jgi:tetratricopeptide (TPR) repeat protein
VGEQMKNEGESKAEFKAWRTFSIFISSTFLDMQEERDHLKNVVFPKVEGELRENRIRLETVDLRWGIDTSTITNESEREAKVLQVCLEEIKRCRPFFIGLLGDRYGWVPSEDRMKEAIRREANLKHKKDKSVTALEIEFGVLASEEQLNRSVFYFRRPLDYSKINVDKKGSFCDEYDHKLSVVQKKERKDALIRLKAEIRKHFKKHGFKKKRGLEDKVKQYNTNWDEDKQEVVNLDKWGKKVYDDIIRECKVQAGNTLDEADRNVYEQEEFLLDAFIEDHTHLVTVSTETGVETISSFCGREKLLAELKEHLLDKKNEKWGLVLTGESGSGKSAVFAKIHRMMQDEDCFILAHSAGISPRSRRLVDLLHKWNWRMCKQLKIEYEMDKPKGRTLNKFGIPDIKQSGLDSREPEFESDKIISKFKELLFTIAEKKQVIILIDALDRFESTARAQHLSWLPQVMPNNVRVLCTAITGTEEKAVSYHAGNLVSRDIDHYTDKEAKEMLDVLCAIQHKDMPAEVKEAILSKKKDESLPACSSPLWLSLAVNILMAMDNYDYEKIMKMAGKPGLTINEYMLILVENYSGDPGKLFISLINKAASYFEEEFTRKIFDYISCSRNGLRESDLENLVPIEEEKWDALTFARMRRWFSSHIRKEGDNLQWNLAHSILRNSLQNRLAEDKFKNIHNAIATHLLTLPEIDDLRISETMFHLMKAGNAEKALDYYVSCSKEDRRGATAVLAEAVSKDEKNLDWCFAILRAGGGNEQKIMRLAPRYIYDLNDALKVEGKLNERQKFLETLCDYVTTKTNLSVNKDFGYDFAALNEKLGEIYQYLGKLDQALEFYKENNRLMKEICRSNPRNERLKLGLAISCEKLGDIYQSLGKLDQAMEFYKKDSELTKELYESNPRNESVKLHLAVSYLELGEVYQSLGKLDQALEFYNNYAELSEELYENNPKDDSVRYSLVCSYERLGNIYQSLGKLGHSLGFYKKYSELSKELFESNPKNESLKYGLAISYDRLGSIYQSLGKSNQALDFYKKYSEFSKELSESNPINEILKNSLAISYGKLGEIYQFLGNIDQARQDYDKYNKLMKELSESDTHNKDIKSNLAVSNERLGEIYQSLGKLDQALGFYIRYAELSKDLYESDPKNFGLFESLGISYYKLAMIYKDIKNDQAGRKYYAKWKKIISFLAENVPGVPKYQKWKQVEY